MLAPESEAQPSGCRITREVDLLRVRQLLRERSHEVGLGLVDETKMVTAGSELARNILKYAGQGGGNLRVEVIRQERRRGVRAVFADQGPGIPDLGLALKDGYSSSGSLGLGLPGAKRLVDEFAIDSQVGRGTTVTIVKWQR